jgi:hypothetical protein
VKAQTPALTKNAKTARSETVAAGKRQTMSQSMRIKPTKKDIAATRCEYMLKLSLWKYVQLDRQAHVDCNSGLYQCRMYSFSLSLYHVGSSS